MRLHANRTLAVPLDRAWRELLDPWTLAAAVPGATLDPDGAVRVATGAYHGSARLEEVDDDTHTATLAVHGREVGGDGAVSGRVRGTLLPDGDAVRLRVVADLHLTGASARAVPRDALEAFVDGFKRGLDTPVVTPPRNRRRVLAVGLAVGAVAVVVLVRRAVRRRGGGRR